MNSSLDLILLPLGGFDRPNQPGVPGLHAATKPRRVARGREPDLLILYLTLVGNAPLPVEQVNEILERLSQIYYQTPGTVTAAQRAVAQTLNQYLLERNLRNASTGRQAVGLFTQVVVRGDRLSLSLCGPTHAILITSSGAEHFYEPLLAGQGLGISRTANAHYALTKIHPNDALLLAPRLPTNWNITNLQSAHSQGPESLRRKVVSQIGIESDAVLIQARVGTGQIRWMRAVRSASAQPAPVPPKAQPESPLQEEVQARPTPEMPPVEASPRQRAEETPAPERVPLGAAMAAEVPQTAKPRRHRGRETTTIGTTPPQKHAAKALALLLTYLARLVSALASLGRKISSLASPVIRAAGRLLQRMLPDSSLFTIPPYTMAFVAFIVPILVVIIASYIYIERGGKAQFDVYYAQALETSRQAQVENDPQALRSIWRTTLDYLDKAEFYKKTDDSKALRAQAQNELDRLDFVERLDFQPALSTRALREDLVITQIALNGDDLYLLNGKEGIVLRATFTEDGYQLDEKFQCGPGPYEGYIVGALSDIVALPPGNNPQATLLGMDSNGNLLFCTPGDVPKAMPMTAPDTQWGKPTAFALDLGDLYVLDTQSNAVWIYRDLDVTESPRFFFSAQVPSLEDVIDLAVNNNDLYLLHTDGRMTTCTYSALAEAPTRCEDPAAYTDPRPGRESRALNEDAPFSQVLFVPPPDPSIYLLQPQSPAVYHLSVRLTFQRQFQPRTPLGDRPATAFAVSRENRLLFLALGNQIYYANLP